MRAERSSVDGSETTSAWSMLSHSQHPPPTNMHSLTHARREGEAGTLTNMQQAKSVSMDRVHSVRAWPHLQMVCVLCPDQRRVCVLCVVCLVACVQKASTSRVQSLQNRTEHPVCCPQKGPGNGLTWTVRLLVTDQERRLRRVRDHGVLKD